MSKPLMVALPEQATLYTFMEERCFTGAGEVRPDRGTAVFRVFTVGRTLGPKFEVEFHSDYGVYYDGDDEHLIAALEAAVPHVNWRTDMVYHRQWERNKIHVLNGDTGRTVAQVETRRYAGRRVSHDHIEAGQYGANVLTMRQVQALKALREQAAAAPEEQKAGE